MKTENRTSEKKQKAIDEAHNAPLKVGDKVYVKYASLSEYNKTKNNQQSPQLVTIKQLNKSDLIVENYAYKNVIIDYSDVVSKEQEFYAGVNPFDEDLRNVEPIAYAFDSILFQLDVLGDKRKPNEKTVMNGVTVQECNWNPYVYVDGVKKYYQRDFCWTLEQKQNLIGSMYLGIDLGKILVRRWEWNDVKKKIENGETEVAWYDIVDGKQRLDALRGFLMNEFPDNDGNYFNDLSFIAQNNFTNNQLLGYAEITGTDEQVLKQFLRMNFEGVPQSKEHLDYVRSLI